MIIFFSEIFNFFSFFKNKLFFQFKVKLSLLITKIKIVYYFDLNPLITEIIFKNKNDALFAMLFYQTLDISIQKIK